MGVVFELQAKLAFQDRKVGVKGFLFNPTALLKKVFFDCASCDDPLGASIGFEEVFEMEQSNTDLYFSDVCHDLSPPWRLSAIVAHQEEREKLQVTKFY